MKNVIVLTAILIVIVSCSNKRGQKDNSQISSDQDEYIVGYDSREIYGQWPGGRSFSIHTNNKFPKIKLNTISDSLIKADNGMNEIIAINYYSCDNIHFPVNINQYATSLSVLGNMKTTVIGLEDDEQLIKNDKNLAEGRFYYGLWNDNVLNATIGIFKANYKHYVEYIYGINARFTLDAEVHYEKGQILVQLTNDKSGIFAIEEEGLCLYRFTPPYDKILCFSKID